MGLLGKTIEIDGEKVKFDDVVKELFPELIKTDGFKEAVIEIVKGDDDLKKEILGSIELTQEIGEVKEFDPTPIIKSIKEDLYEEIDKKIKKASGASFVEKAGKGVNPADIAMVVLEMSRVPMGGGAFRYDINDQKINNAISLVREIHGKL